ncbi:MAG: zinc-ribbon domain containing protein [Oscillospiraceae bacterium]|nr:zinc-ribbon domain containing protein [Oscillospiraceae bacterium]
MYEDIILVCRDCGNEFTFTAGEQEFYTQQGFQNQPLSCKECRIARKNANRVPKEMHITTCARCGKEARVPFLPVEDRPVYCSECFAIMKEEG